MKYPGIILICLVIGFGSCQKVLNVNLNSVVSKYTVTGNITDQPGPYTISITKTVDFNQDNNFPGISGATVFITDSNLNITDTLSEKSVGNYQTHILTGISGHTYHMGIIVAGSVFSSSSTMPQAVVIDTLYTTAAMFGNNLDVVPEYKDPVGVGNNYHLLLKIKDSTSQDVIIHNDALKDGAEVMETLRNNIDIHSGDSITVELQCIDKAVYQYYQDLSQTIQQNSATPANPQSNISGGTLGYFSAHTVNRKTIVAP